MVALQDPEACKRCLVRGVVIESRHSKKGYRRRRHQCPNCKVRWSSWQTVLSPFRVRVRVSTDTHTM